MGAQHQGAVSEALFDVLPALETAPRLRAPIGGKQQISTDKLTELCND
jgi:hypothetical protein